VTPKSRLFAAALLAATVAGCRAKDGTKYDYYSTNKDSWTFLKETFKEDRQLRKASFRETWNWSEIRRWNKRNRKESLAYGWGAFWGGSIDEARNAWEFLKTDTTEDAGALWGKHFLFGFLDSGDP
jgi:ABC-type uncharacterized transport system auxiliary subunit